MTVYEGRAVWAPKTDKAAGAWVEIKEIGKRIELTVCPIGDVARSAYLERDQARTLARQLYALARIGDKRDAT